MRLCADMTADLFHFGHVRLLRGIKERWPGCHLTVLLCGDDATVGAKGKRPVMSLDERAEVVAACRYVDDLIKIYRPYEPELVDRFDLMVRGDEGWDRSGIPEALKEWYEYAQSRGKLAYLPYTQEISTTKIVQRIRVAEGSAT